MTGLGAGPPLAEPVLAAVTWREAVAAEPVKAVVAGIALVVVTLGAATVLRRLSRHARSVRHQILGITMAALVLGAVSALGLAWLMVLDGAGLETVLSVLGVTAVSASVLVWLATTPLGRDVERLEQTVRRIEEGDRTVRAGLTRSDELGHVGAALDALNCRLDDLERARATFEEERTLLLSSVSHDLRTPIAALRAATEALADGIAPDPERYLSSMQRDIEALTGLVDDLFLLVRLDSGRLELPSGQVDLTEIADEAVEALTPVATARQVRLVLAAAGGRVRVRGNASALGRVIRNLIDNAIRHAPPGTAVRVAVDADTRRVRVSDEGEGFDPTFVDHAFDHFTRADSSRARTTGGAGLGLAIARGVVEAHGGQIWIEDAPGGHVAFELPAA